MKSFILILTILILAGCSGSGSGSGPGMNGGVDAAGTGLEGLWFYEAEAKEFRETGRIDSICEEIKKKPNLTITNIHSIEADGTVYNRHPRFGKIEDLKMGQIMASGEFVLTSRYKEQTEIVSAKASVERDTLTLEYWFTKGHGDLKYLRSSEDEMRRYFEFQDSCRN